MAEQENKTRDKITLQFAPLDTWFFRESRPHDAAGASELSSLFPPSIRTLMGATRRFIGDSINIQWDQFNDGIATAHDISGLDFKMAVGDSQDLGELSAQGAWVTYNDERLYPVPFYLMHKEDELTRLQIGDIAQCDLGNVRLPEFPKDKEGFKNLQQSWINSQGLQKLLAGNALPDEAEIISITQLLTPESRLGIARDNATRSVVEGQLYQTQHIRMQENVAVELDLYGLDERIQPRLKQSDIIRLGGEGRMAALTIKQDSTTLPFIKANTQPIHKIIIHFISAADFDEKMFPETFEKKEINGQTVWQGRVEGIELIIEAAVIGKVYREGGWDMQKHQPRSVKSYIPAGSAWFCRIVDSSLSGEAVVQALHEKCIGLDRQWGRGQILIGKWLDDQQGEINDNK